MKKLLACLLLVSGTQTGVLAQTTFSATYDFGLGTSNNVTNFPYNGMPVTNLSIGPMVKSPGINTTIAQGGASFRGTAWTTNSSIDTNDYIGFSVAANPGFVLSISNLSFGVNRSATGPRRFVWYASTNGFTTSVVLTGFTAVNTNWSASNGVISLVSGTNVAINYLGNVLAAAGLVNLTNVDFRLYGFLPATTPPLAASVVPSPSPDPSPPSEATRSSGMATA